MLGKLKKNTGISQRKQYRQVKIIQGGQQGSMEFIADIPEGSDEMEKMEELFETVFKKLQQVKFYEENK